MSSRQADTEQRTPGHAKVQWYRKTGLQKQCLRASASEVLINLPASLLEAQGFGQASTLVQCAMSMLTCCPSKRFEGVLLILAGLLMRLPLVSYLVVDFLGRAPSGNSRLGCFTSLQDIDSQWPTG